MDINENSTTEEKKEKVNTFQILSSFRRFMLEFKNDNGTYFTQENGEYVADSRVIERYAELTSSLLEHEIEEVAEDIADPTQLNKEAVAATRALIKELKSGNTSFLTANSENQAVAEDVAAAIVQELIPQLFPGDDAAIDAMEDIDVARAHEIIGRHLENIHTASSLYVDNLKKDDNYEAFNESEQRRIQAELANQNNEEELFYDATFEQVEEQSEEREFTDPSFESTPGFDASSFISTETPKKGIFDKLRENFGKLRENRENRKKEREEKNKEKESSKPEKGKEEKEKEEKKKEPKKPKKSSNKMLNVVRGLAPIPNEYYAAAINSWVSVFKESPIKVLEDIKEAEQILEEVEEIVENHVDEVDLEESVDTNQGERVNNENEVLLDNVQRDDDAVDEATNNEQIDQLQNDLQNGSLSPQQPLGIECLAADALWQDMYLTVGELKTEKGQYKIGNTTASLLKIASNNATPEELSKVEQKRVKEILIQAYTNHAEYMLGYDIATLFEEVKAMGIDIDFSQLSGENQQEQMAKAIAEAKYKYFEGANLSPRGWARLALTELSQAKYNPETGDINNRKDSPFYRELQRSGVIFDLDAYQEAIQENINSQLEELVSVTNVDNLNKDIVTIINPEGKEVEVYAIEINGVNCYIANPPTTPPQVIETDTIDQTKDPKLVDINDVIDFVGRERALLEGVKVVDGARADMSQYSQLTGVSLNASSETPKILTTFEQDGKVTMQVSSKDDGPSL